MSTPALSALCSRLLRPALALAALLALLASADAAAVPAKHVHDLSVLVSPKYPCVWPVGMAQHLVTPSRTFGPGAYRRDLIVIDEHTGTQWDAPAHFVPPPKSGLPGAGPMGVVTGDKVPAWQFVGEACVLDFRKDANRAANGHSFLITADHVKAWEKKNRPLGFGDVVLFRGGYDANYKPLAKGGERYVALPLRKETPAWPAPTPECMKYIASRQVMALGIDSPSMGPLPDLAAATHLAGSEKGMIWTECAANLGALPTTGAAYFLLAPKHAGGSGSEARALAITEPTLAARLLKSARAKKVLDLSVTLDEELPITWPGRAAGGEASRYVANTLNRFHKARGPFFANAHLLDAQAGTHVVPPVYSLPPKGFDDGKYSPAIRAILKDYEATFGPRGHSDETADKVPLDALMGDAHVVDVRKLRGTVARDRWPASPAITLAWLKEHEKKVRPIEAGEVVIFRTGHDEHFKPLPELPKLDPFFAAPLAGQAEGWPAPTAEVLAYLGKKKVRCVGTDGPTLGGVEARNALMVYWAAAKHGVYPVEMLTNVGKVPQKGGFFIFAPVKIAGSHGGYGRALGLY